MATWRHLFKNGGWKSLEGVDAIKPQVREKMEKRLAGFTWNYFVEEVVLKDTYVNESKVELDNFDEMGAWIKNHWAPYWWGSFDLLIPIGTAHFRRYTCRVCSKDHFPDFILKTETLPWDIPLVCRTTLSSPIFALLAAMTMGQKGTSRQRTLSGNIIPGSVRNRPRDYPSCTRRP